MTVLPGRLRVAASAVVGVFGFILLLTSVSQVFGGGVQGLMVALILAILIAMAVLVFPMRWLVLGVKDSAPKPRDIEPLPDFDHTKRSRPKRSTVESLYGLDEEVVCDPGPYNVERGEVEEIELNVAKGDRIRGKLVELEGRDFDWYIVDDEGLVTLLRGKVPESAAHGRRVNADTVSWTARRVGPWFLAIDIYGRTAKRIVRVDLRRQ